MIEPFIFTGFPVKILFGVGRRNEVGEWIERLEHHRALILSTPQQEEDARSLASQIGQLAAGVFAGAAMHTPVETTDKATDIANRVGADCIVALGGGSTTGLGKAIAYRTDLDQIVIPTTYAGSEVTDILGQTDQAGKTTLRDPKIRPEVVIYDPEVTVGLPVAMSVHSGLNAMAHAAEGLYADDRNPITSMMSVAGLQALRDALPIIIREPGNLSARSEALYGAWLCGTVLGSISMSLHHKICHTLGGSFGLPHAETHAVMLPHTIGYNAAAVPDLLRPVTELFGSEPGGALFDFAGAVNAPLSLRELGMDKDDLGKAARLATENPYKNPRKIDKESIYALLLQAWNGDRPGG